MNSARSIGWAVEFVGMVLVACLGGCSNAASGPADSQKPAAGHAGFRDVAQEVGLDFRMNFLPNEQGSNFKINLYDHGCGLAVGDYDNDGLEDIYFLNQLGPNALYHNRGDGQFEEVTARMGVELEDRVGVAATFADYDNDGDQDLYVTSTRGGNVLFRNENGVVFHNVTEQAGLTHAGHSQTAVFFDYNNDSWLDLYLVQTAEWTADYDHDQQYFVGKGGGGLEAVVFSPKESNILYRNNGDGVFIDVTAETRMAGRGWSGDAAVFDYDGDGWQDVFVTCMFGRAQLYRNDRGKTFDDVTLAVLGRTPFGGVGAKTFDCDNDGDLDLYVADMHSDMWMGLEYSQTSQSKAIVSQSKRFDDYFGPDVKNSPELQKREAEFAEQMGFRHDEVVFGNAFYENLGHGEFREISQANNTETFWPWGIATGDYDNDGFEDAFVSTGMGYPFYYWHNYLLMNDRGQAFTERSRALGVEPPVGGPTMMETIDGRPCARSSRCAVTADFDHDGRLEIVTNNFNQSPYFFKNDFPQRSYLALRLRGTQSNRDAVGALVRVHAGDQILTRQVHAAGGYLSQSSQVLHFGLGERTNVDRIEVVWPSGVQQDLGKLALNRLHELVEPEKTPAA